METRVFLRCVGIPLVIGLVSAAGAQTEETSKPDEKKAAAAATRPARRMSVPAPRVVFEVVQSKRELGKIVIELSAEKAPLTVKNFLRYVEEGFYDGTIFHRVRPDFLIQGGAYLSRTRRKTDGLHEPIRSEAENDLKNLRGTIAMARRADPDSARAEFFINAVDNPKLDYPGHEDWGGFCVFGRVVEGMEVVDEIKAVRARVSPEARRAYMAARRTDRDTPAPKAEQPVDPPLIRKAYRLAVGEQVTPVKPPAPEPEPEHEPEEEEAEEEVIPE